MVRTVGLRRQLSGWFPPFTPSFPTPVLFFSIIFQHFPFFLPFPCFHFFHTFSIFSLFEHFSTPFHRFFGQVTSLFWTRHLRHTHDIETNVSFAACFCAFSVARRVHTSTWPQRVIFSRKVKERKVLIIRPIRTFAFFLGNKDDSQMRETTNFHFLGPCQQEGPT